MGRYTLHPSHNYLYIYNIVAQPRLWSFFFWTFRQRKCFLAALAGSIRPLRASLAASNRLLESLERPESSNEADRASPTGDLRRSWVDVGIDFQRFSSFFEVPSRGRLDSLRPVPNLRFCWQAEYFRGFADSP